MDKTTHPYSDHEKEKDFSDLVQAKKALAEIHVLTQAGIGLTKLERFHSGLINLVIDAAFDVFL